jgi:MYXO-CTERM domain-containing protein
MNLHLAAALAGALVASGASASVAYGPSPYVTFLDSPFFSLPGWTYFHLEDFEDGALNTPGASASPTSILAPGTFTDSVDGDDGVVDGLGQRGHSLYSAGSRSIEFTFNALTLGGLPTHVGIVWTDVGFSDDPVPQPALFGDIVVEGFGPGGVSLGTTTLLAHGDLSAQGGTAEDRFFGFGNPAGIEKLTIRMNSDDWEVDHLQYGLVPEPGTVAAGAGLAALAAGLAWRRRRA